MWEILASQIRTEASRILLGPPGLPSQGARASRRPSLEVVLGEDEEKTLHSPASWVWFSLSLLKKLKICLLSREDLFAKVKKH